MDNLGGKKQAESIIEDKKKCLNIFKVWLLVFHYHL